MKSYNTEIISVGTELLLGHVTNTDARDISELLSKIGINVLYHTVVGDNPERVKSALRWPKSGPISSSPPAALAPPVTI